MKFIVDFCRSLCILKIKVKSFLTEVGDQVTE